MGFDECYEKLAAAIVVQAAKDYKAALRQEARGKVTPSTQGTIIECERFFESQWFEALSDLDGPVLMERIKKLALADFEGDEEDD